MKNFAKAIVIMIVVLMVLIPFASTYPDGLEKVVESFGIEEPQPPWKGLMPDYTFTAITDSYLATLTSGLIGVLLVCSIAWIMSLIATHKNKNSESS
ncbi:MAG: PDGLE domain-containing protein [Candidatus Bathyarchaeia archaeon]